MISSTPGRASKGAVDRPVVGVNQRRFTRPNNVLIANGLRRQLGADRVPMRRRPVLPVRQLGRPQWALDRLSERRCVLNHDASHTIGMLEYQAVSDRAAEIHHVHGETRDPELLDQRLNHLRKMGVRIVEIGARRDSAVSECRIVGRDHPVLVGEHRNEVSEHAGRCRKPVEQQYDRRRFGTGLAIEDLQSIHIDGPIVRFGRRPSMRGNGRQFRRRSASRRC